MKLGILRGGHPLALHPGLGTANFAYVVPAKGLIPYESSCYRRETLSEIGVPRDDAAPEQGLAFPDLGPPSVVDLVGGQAPGLGSLTSFRPQGGVDSVEARGRRLPSEDADQSGGIPFGRGGGLGLTQPARVVVNE